MKKSLILISLVMAGVLLGVLCASPALAQNTRPAPKNLQTTDADAVAADGATVVYQHVRPAATPAGDSFDRSQFTTPAQRANTNAGPVSPNANFSGANGNDQNRFPADLSYLGGAVVPFAQSHPIFLLPNGSCPIATCWGDPESFLTDFAESTLAHVTDQYVGQHSDDRYTLGNELALSYKPPAVPLTDGNIRAVVHAAALASGHTGYGHIYHVFLPPGQDECFSAADTVCYSPDKPNSFVFCAYHNSVTFKDIGHVLYTVEPFQNVDGCRVRPGTPNGQLIDSTNSTLSHELIETITDPDGDAWFNFTAVVLAGAEIGDECQLFVIQQISPMKFAAFGDPTVFRVGKHIYATQSEYNNVDHACSIAP